MAEVEDWLEKFLLGAENALRTRLKDKEALKLYHLDRKTADVSKLLCRASRNTEAARC